MQSTAARHAARVLADLGVTDLADRAALPAEAPHPDDDWAASGAQWLTGEATSPPRPIAAPVAACARGAVLALERLSPAVAALGLDGPALLGERAALAGLQRRGRTTAGGSGRLLRTRDGWLAVQLPRPDDLAALPAWLEAAPPHGGDVFAWLAAELATREAAWLEERARWLGLAVASLPSRGAAPDDAAGPDAGSTWMRRLSGAGAARPTRPAGRRMRVLDLSSLWAGPLCASLLGCAGADVAKVEHPRRPDGARGGPARFFDLMHAGKSSVALDATSPRDRAQLLALIEAADVVVESARPRALAQLGIDADACVAAHPGLTWISITGYGRGGPAHDPLAFGDRIAFGDDAAVAGGLVAEDEHGLPVFCADAVADPLTGLHAALCALAGARSGGGLFDVSLAGVARMVATTPRAEASLATPAPVRPPRARATAQAARPIGADTRAVCERWCRLAPHPGPARTC